MPIKPLAPSDVKWGSCRGPDPLLPFDSTLANFGAIASIVGLVLAVVVTLKYHVRSRFFRSLDGSGNDDEPVAKPNRASAPVLTPTTLPPATPNTSLSLQQMLDSAKSVAYDSDRSGALRLVAKHAVKHGEYEKAIEAGEADPYDSSKSETLKFVAISAAHGGSFEEAARAAKKIPYSSTQGQATKKILEIQSKLE